MEQIALDVSDLDGADAERAVTAALITIPGVEWATAAADHGVVSAQYDPELADLDGLRSAIEGAGYGLRTVPTE